MNKQTKAYYEAKIMQSLGYLDPSINPVEYADEKVKDKPESKDEGFKEYENPMVVGEYYKEGE